MPSSEILPEPLGLRFSPVARLRPVDVVQPGTRLDDVSSVAEAPCAAAEVLLGPQGGRVSLRSGLAGPDAGPWLAAVSDGRRVWLEAGRGRRTSRHVSRRHALLPGGAARADRLAISLTGRRAAAWSRGPLGGWRVHAVLDLTAAQVRRMVALRADGSREPTSGRFGQLGLRDLRLVTQADGRPYRERPGGVLLTATSAGPGGFATAHASVWELDTAALTLAHRADLFFSRDDGIRGGGQVFADHAIHLLRDGAPGSHASQGWLVATSTWADFDPVEHRFVTTRLGRSDADLTRGAHVVPTRAWELPVPGLPSVGRWDPHVLHDGEQWQVAFVTASRYFRFGPALAAGPGLDQLRLVAADPRRRATEGVTLVPGGPLTMLASDGRHGRPGERGRYPVLRPDGAGGLVEAGVLAAAYPTNLPWPTLVPPEAAGDDWLMVGFDGAARGGPLPGYGTHGAVVVQRAARSDVGMAAGITAQDGAQGSPNAPG